MDYTPFGQTAMLHASGYWLCSTTTDKLYAITVFNVTHIAFIGTQHVVEMFVY